MPCRDGGDPNLEYMGGRYVTDPAVQGRLDKVARLLCFVMNHLHGSAPDHIYKRVLSNNRELAQWWKEHRRFDAARVAEEDDARRRDLLRKSAIAKLSPAERAALGV